MVNKKSWTKKEQLSKEQLSIAFSNLELVLECNIYIDILHSLDTETKEVETIATICVTII